MAQEKQVRHSFSSDFGVMLNGEQVFGHQDTRVATSIFSLGYSREVIKQRNHGLQGNVLRLKTEILSGFYVPILFSVIAKHKDPFNEFIAYAPNFMDLAKIDYQVKSSAQLALGITFRDLIFHHGPWLFNPRKFSLGASFNYIPVKAQNRYNFEFDLSRTILTPTFIKNYDPSPYNALGLHARANWHLFKEKEHLIYGGVHIWNMVKLGTWFEPDQGHFYRIDIGFRLSLTTTKNDN